MQTHWLNAKRLYVYPRMMLVLLVLMALGWLATAKHGVDAMGKPLGYDFITFWAASHLALAGKAALAYQIPALFEAEKLAVPASHAVFVWYYPPPFFLVVLPLASMPFFVAYWFFQLGSLASYVVAFRRVMRGRAAMWCFAAFPGIWLNVFHGQNACLTAAFAAGFFVCLCHKKPALAGIFLGCMLVKPHLAILFPLSLLAARAWSALWSACASTALWIGVSTYVFGWQCWRDSWSSMRYARLFLEQGILPWGKMPTVFAFLRMDGVSVPYAYAVHLIVALLVAYSVWRVCRSTQDWSLRGAYVMTATFLISPYIFDYDLAWLAFPIAWMTQAGLQHGWLAGEREVLVAAWALPLAMAPAVTLLHIQIGPVVSGALLWMIARRVCTQNAIKSMGTEGSRRELGV